MKYTQQAEKEVVPMLDALAGIPEEEDRLLVEVAASALMYGIAYQRRREARRSAAGVDAAGPGA